MKVKVLMVCLGNICRSPLAEGILKSKVDVKKIYVDSAGTGSWHIGEQPDQRSIAVAKKNGIDITSQRGRQFSGTDFHDFDKIYVMDNSNMRDVMSLCPNPNLENKVQLILDELFPNDNVDVPDPYYGGSSGFDDVFNMLDQACQEIADKL
jgi:protein-tyrosine phosphatase